MRLLFVVLVLTLIAGGGVPIYAQSAGIREVTASDREAGEAKLHMTLEQHEDGWVRVD